MCTGFVFGLGIIHWACGCSTPPFTPFSPGVIAIGGLRIHIELCNSFRVYVCSLDLSIANVKPCKSYVSLNVMLIKMKLCLHSFESLCKAMWADHLLGRCVEIKLIKSLYSFFYACLCTPGVVTRWAMYSGVWPLTYLYIFPLCFVSTGLICKACSLAIVHFTGKTLSVSFQKFCSTDDPDLTRVGGRRRWY